MALPILTELNQDLQRLTVAGSTHAKGDPRLKKYIPTLEKLGERAPVFGELARRVSALAAGDDMSGTAALISTSLLLTSVMYTQGSTKTDADILEPAYAQTPLVIVPSPYSRLNDVISILEEGGQKASTRLTELLANNSCRDPRLFPSYLKAITDAKSPISDFVCNDILPDIGTDILPFLLEDFNPKGSKRHARILKILAGMMGGDIFSLAEKALAEGEPYVIAEALRALEQDPMYEETLLAYAGDRKGEIRGAALAGLAVMESERGSDLLLQGLDKDSITFLQEALILSSSAAVAAKILEQIKTLKPEAKKNSTKLRILLTALAARRETEGLAFLEDLLSDKTFYAELRYDLELDKIMHTLCVSDMDEKARMVIRICDGDTSRADYKLQACIRFYAPEDVYNLCHKDAKHLSFYTLCQAYGYQENPDPQATSVPKPWDRRWAHLYTKDHPEWAWQMAHDDDTTIWKTLLETASAKEKENMPAYYKAMFHRVLIEAFRRGHPDAMKYFKKFVKNGASQETLAHDINQVVPGAVEG